MGDVRDFRKKQETAKTWLFLEENGNYLYKSGSQRLKKLKETACELLQ